MRRVATLALVAAVVAGGSISAAAHSGTTSPDCPVPTGAGAFDTHLSPSSGPAGTTVTVSGALPQGATEVFAYGNLDFDKWTSIYTAPQAAVAGSAVQQLGAQDVAALCGYRFEVTIPSVPPGSYPIEVVYRWEPGYPDGTGWGEASFLPASFQVTAG